MMADNRVRFELDEVRLRARLSGMTKKAQYAIDSQVIRDTTPYVPRDSGVLAGSAERVSKVGEGDIRWDTPYAATQYYSLPNKSGAVHPKATMKWFEVAKGVHLPAWIRVMKRAIANL